GSIAEWRLGCSEPSNVNSGGTGRIVAPVSQYEGARARLGAVLLPRARGGVVSARQGKRALRIRRQSLHRDRQFEATQSLTGRAIERTRDTAVTQWRNPIGSSSQAKSVRV